MPKTFLADASCPACNTAGLEYDSEQVDLPYLGESLETCMRCGACGYRHTDFVLLATKDPTRATYTVRTAEDMSVRVVRSGSGTIRIPEHGILIEPGVASEAFISNIEGILVRIEAILMQLRRDAEAHGDAKSRDAADALLETFEAAREGDAKPMTLILEDPLGNSAIISDDAVVEAIPPEEAERLSLGMPVMDQDSASALAHLDDAVTAADEEE